MFRLTPAIIGLTVVAAGTSVPELAVSGIAAFQGSSDISVGNVVGSNLFNIALILGLSAVVRPLVITGNTAKLEYPVMALATRMVVAICQDGSINQVDAAHGACRLHGLRRQPCPGADDRGRGQEV